MADAAHATLAHDSIVVGCDFALDVVVEPKPGQTADDVITALGSPATATAVVLDLDGLTTLATATVAITAATRTLQLSMTDAATSALDPGPGRWRVLITTASGAVWPVRMPPAQIRALP